MGGEAKQNGARRKVLERCNESAAHREKPLSCNWIVLRTIRILHAIGSQPERFFEKRRNSGGDYRLALRLARKRHTQRRREHGYT
jgi:hypothetical protein